MKVNLIIPTYKPGEKLRQSLKRLAMQTRKLDKIILINTEEAYFDQKMILPYENVEVYHIKKEEFDHGATRDLGASLAKDADILMFMTDDAVPKDKYLVENLIKAFDNPEVAAAYGRQMADPKQNYIEYYTRMFNYPEESRIKTKADLKTMGIKTFFCSNVCSAYKKADYDAMGGFEHKTIFNEDMIMASKLIEAGKAIAYQADARVWHWHDYNAMEQLHRNFDLAVSQVDHGGLFLKVKSESEGVKMVVTTIKHLILNGKIYLIPKYVMDTGFKLIGYKLGKNYKKLPDWMILKLTMNKGYWNLHKNLMK